MEIYGPDYGRSESINGPYYSCLISTIKLEPNILGLWIPSCRQCDVFGSLQPETLPKTKHDTFHVFFYAFAKLICLLWYSRDHPQVPSSSRSMRCWLQDEEHSVSRPRLFPGLCHMCSGTSPEWIRSNLHLAGSQGNPQVVRKCLKRGFPSYWIPVTTSLLLYHHFLRKIEI